MNKKRRLFAGAMVLVLLAVAGGACFFLYSYYQYVGMNPAGEYFMSDGARIHYVVEGGGAPVILVHGLGADIGLNWVQPGILPTLAKKYQVVAFDLRGHGRSDKPHDPSQYGLKLVEDIIALMDHLKIQKAHVIGYSMGGFIVSKLAAMHPDRLLTVAPCGSGWTANPDKDMAFLHALAEALDRNEGYGLLLERLQPVGKPVNKSRIRTVSAMMSLRNDQMAIAAMLHSSDALRVDESSLRNNQVPALSIVGARDPLKGLADQMAAIMTNMEEVVIPEANHFSTLGKPGVIAALEQFLAAHTPAVGPAAMGACYRLAWKATQTVWAPDGCRQ